MHENLISFNCYEWHKGFYCEEEPRKALSNIDYLDYFDEHEDEDFPLMSAEELLCGACEHFAVMLKKLLNYNVYIIEQKNGFGFHAFCQVYKNKTWYYIDARGVTTSFNEFMDVVKRYVGDEYIIRQATSNDIFEWENDFEYNEETYAFSKKIIENYKTYYTID